MSITANQAKLLISHAEPCEETVQIREETFDRMGIDIRQLEEAPFYRGAVIHSSEGIAHVMARDGLEQASGMKWADYESARADVRRVSTMDL